MYGDFQWAVAVISDRLPDDRVRYDMYTPHVSYREACFICIHTALPVWDTPRAVCSVYRTV